MEGYVLYGGNVITIDASKPFAQAVVIEADRISYVGSVREAFARAPKNAKLIDLRGKTLIPGFNDNHIHTLAMGEFFSLPRLHGLNGPGIIEFLKAAFSDVKPGKLLFALGWDYPSCPEPHRSLLDVAFPQNPLVLIQFSGHGMWLNSAALKLFGINGETPDPVGGTILRDKSGEPTGILRDAATRPIHRVRYRRMHSKRGHSGHLLDRALENLREAGITSVQDNTWYPVTLRLLKRHRKSGLLTCRFSCWFLGMQPFRSRLMQLQPVDDLWISKGPWKYFLDGTFTTKTAYLIEPYSNDGENFGMRDPVFGSLETLLIHAARKRRQLAFHAIGDRAVKEFLDSFERVQQMAPHISDLRIRLEHAQLIHPDDIPRIRDLGIIISAQPSALGTPEKDAALLGKERAEAAYPYRSLLNSGVHLCFGSDMPGESSFDPILGIYRAVNRSGRESITALEALTCYTLGSAYAEFREMQKGSITPGKLADLAVLTEDPLAVHSAKIKDIRVHMTIVDGRIVYAAE